MAWTSSARSRGQTPENRIGEVMPRATLFRSRVTRRSDKFEEQSMETIRESNRIGAGTEGRKRDILKIGIIVGSTRPGRKAVAVGKRLEVVCLWDQEPQGG